jgi:outer membrane immunogenic protein
MTIPVARSARCLLAHAIAIVALAATLPMSTPSALAADIPVAPPPPPVVVPPLWTGFYIGVHGGWGGGSTHIVDPTFRVAYQTISYATSGPLYGGQIGADWQFGSFVVGAELDGSAGTIKGNSTLDPAFPISGFATKFRTLATAGYAAGSFLGYAKLGFAWADIELTNRLFSPVPQVIEHSRTGILGGAGLEMLLIGNLSAKFEYNFIYLGATSMALSNTVFLGPQSVDHTLHLVKAGLNLRFGGGDFIVARY